MQTPFRSGHIYTKYAYSAESNEISIYWFLFFELWLILFTFYGTHLDFQVFHRPKKNRQKVYKFTEKMRNLLKRMKNHFSDFNFLRYGWFCTEIPKKIMLRGYNPLNPLFLWWPLHPPPVALNAFRLNPPSPSQLVLRFHWLTFLNQVRVTPTKKKYCLKVV